MGSIVFTSRGKCEFDRETMLNTAANQLVSKIDRMRFQEPDPYEDILCLISSYRHMARISRKSCVCFVDSVDGNKEKANRLGRRRNLSFPPEVQSTKERENLLWLGNTRTSKSMVLPACKYAPNEGQCPLSCSNPEISELLQSHRRNGRRCWKLEPLPSPILRRYAARQAASLKTTQPCRCAPHPD